MQFALREVARALMVAVALRTLWGWWVAPTFGLAPLTWPQAVGLGCLSGVFFMEMIAFVGVLSPYGMRKIQGNDLDPPSENKLGNYALFVQAEGLITLVVMAWLATLVS